MRSQLPKRLQFKHQSSVSSQSINTRLHLLQLVNDENQKSVD